MKYQEEARQKMLTEQEIENMRSRGTALERKAVAEIERLLAAVSWMAGINPELVEEAREKYQIHN